MSTDMINSLSPIGSVAKYSLSSSTECVIRGMCFFRWPFVSLANLCGRTCIEALALLGSPPRAAGRGIDPR